LITVAFAIIDDFVLGRKVSKVTPEFADIAFERDTANLSQRKNVGFGESAFLQKPVIHDENRLRFPYRHNLAPRFWELLWKVGVTRFDTQSKNLIYVDI
jgi:hypothetical protein